MDGESIMAQQALFNLHILLNSIFSWSIQNYLKLTIQWCCTVNPVKKYFSDAFTGLMNSAHPC